MFWSVYAEGVSNWDLLDKKEQQEFLQQFEHENSILHGRTEREVVFFKSNDKNVSSFYCHNSPKYLFILDYNNILEKYTAPIVQFFDVYHEGFHAFIHDVATKKAKLNSIQNLNGDRLYGRRQKVNFIANAMLELDKELANLISYEEQCVRKESLLYASYLTLQVLKLHQLSNKYEKRFIRGYIRLLIEHNAYRKCCNSISMKTQIDILSNKIMSNKMFENELMGLIPNSHEAKDIIPPVSEEKTKKAEILFNEIPKSFIIELTDRLLKEEKTWTNVPNYDFVDNELRVSADLLK